MEQNKLTEIAYEMQAAYCKQKSQGEAIEQVRNIWKDADINLLWAMWAAIDAYVDIKGIMEND